MRDKTHCTWTKFSLALSPSSCFSLAILFKASTEVAPHISLKEAQEIPFSENFPSNFINKRWPLCCNMFNNLSLLIQEKLLLFRTTQPVHQGTSLKSQAGSQSSRYEALTALAHLATHTHSHISASRDLVLPGSLTTGSKAQGHWCLYFGKYSDLPANQDFSKRLFQVSILKQGKGHKKQQAEEKLFA